jgi:hypothetical protein
MKKKKIGNCKTWFAHQTSGFSIFIGCINNYWNNCSSFFKVDMITSSFDTTCPKKNHYHQLLVVMLMPSQGSNEKTLIIKEDTRYYCHILPQSTRQLYCL